MNRSETPSHTEHPDDAVDTPAEGIETTDDTVDTPAEGIETTDDTVDTPAEDVATPQEQTDTSRDAEFEATSSDESDGEESPRGQPPQSDPAEQLDPVETAAMVEAILFATSRAISVSKIQQVAELPNRHVVKNAIETLNRRYDEIGCAFRIESIAGGYQVLTREEYDDVVSRLFKVKSDSKLSSAAMETLSIIAYRQPIMRADIEAIRGVSSGEMVRKLMEKNLVKIVGRAEVLGRPMLYGTTTFFLEAFGLSSIEDLPRVDELRPKPQPPDEATDADETSDADESSEEDLAHPEDNRSTGPDEDAAAETAEGNPDQPPAEESTDEEPSGEEVVDEEE
jgi:segregation and condensation protein B